MNDTRTSSDGTVAPRLAARLLYASALGLLGAGAGGWIAYDQVDPVVQFVALTLAFASVLASITLAVLALGEVEGKDHPPPQAGPCPLDRGRRWNGTGSPRAAVGQRWATHERSGSR